MMRPLLHRCRGDAGQVGGMEVLPFGFLIFISGTLLFANVWGVIDAKLAVTSAAREAARAYVEAPNAVAANTAADQRAMETLAAYGRDGERAQVVVPAVSNGYTRCARVSVTVSYDVPAVAIPFIGGFGDLAPVTSTYTELIDPFRDGISGEALC
jgi:Flp pilus assembly protein TadG